MQTFHNSLSASGEVKYPIPYSHLKADDDEPYRKLSST